MISKDINFNLNEINQQNKSNVFQANPDDIQILDQILLNLLEKNNPPNIQQAFQYKYKHSVKYHSKKKFKFFSFQFQMPKPLKEKINFVKNKLKQKLKSNQNLQNEIQNMQQNKMNQQQSQSLSLSSKNINETQKLQPWQQFSPGVSLYFSLLKYLTILFVILFINSLPMILCNINGKGLSIYQHQYQINSNNQYEKRNGNNKIGLMKISLANLAVVDFTQNINDENFQYQTSKDQNTQQPKNKQKNIEFNDNRVQKNSFFYRFIIILNDLYLTLIIVLFLIFWQIKSRQFINKNNDIIDLPSYRTLIVKDIFKGSIKNNPHEFSQNINKYQIELKNLEKINNIIPQEFKQEQKKQQLEIEYDSDTQRKLKKNTKLNNKKLLKKQYKKKPNLTNNTIQLVWQNLIKSHFMKFGPVDSVALVYDYDETLFQLKQFNQLVKNYSASQIQYQKFKLYQELIHKFQKIKKDYLKMTQQNVKIYGVPFLPKKAFVTFKYKEDKNRVKNLYKYKVNVKDLKFSLLQQIQKKSIINTQNFMRYQEDNENICRVKSCHTQPVSIIWQNFHRQRGKQFKTTLLIGGFLTLILFLALVAVLLLSVQKADLIDSMVRPNFNQSQQLEHMNSNNPAAFYQFQTISHPSYAQALHTSNPRTLYNFCSNLNFNLNSGLQYYSLCKQYFLNFSQKYLTMFSMSLVIACINLILNRIIYVLADFRRHRTQTQRKRFLILNIFMVYFVTMVVVTLLLRADFSQAQSNQYGLDNSEEISLIYFMKQIFPQFMQHRKIQTYSQFNRKWYIHIGTQLIFNFVVALILCPYFYIFEYWIFEKVPELIVTKFKIKKYMKNQNEVNQLLLSQQFDFQTYYAMLLNSFFFCLVFGTGMPIFYLLGAISLFSQYITSQFIFFHLCKVPQPFDHSINKFVKKFMILGLALHQFMAIFFLYVDDIFLTSKTQESQKQIKGFFYKLKNGWIFVIIFCLIMIFYLFDKEITTIFQKKFLNNKQLIEQQISQDINKNQNNSRLSKKSNKNQFKHSCGIDEKSPIKKQKFSVEIKQPFPKIVVKSQAQRLSFQRKYYYRIQDNPLYMNIFYTLTVFHKIVYSNQYFSNTKIQQPEKQEQVQCQKNRNKIIQNKIQNKNYYERSQMKKQQNDFEKKQINQNLQQGIYCDDILRNV